MDKSYLLLFPAQATPVGVVPAHLFTVRTDAERFDALAEGATDVSGDPAYESTWDHEGTGGEIETGHVFDNYSFH